MKKQPLKKSSHKPLVKELKFPSIYRSITEAIPQSLLKEKKLLASSLLTGVLLFALYFSAKEFQEALTQKVAIDQERKTAVMHLLYWEGITKKYTNYRDGYFQVALLSFQLNNMKRAKEMVKKTLTLDPNFSEGQQLEKIFGDK